MKVYCIIKLWCELYYC